MDILVLGPGCINCITLEKRVRTALEDLGVQAEVDKVTDYLEIVKYGVMRTPALVIDGKVVLYGRVPTVEELKTIISGKVDK
jgi:small redox-active disulfide protein 2